MFVFLKRGRLPARKCAYLRCIYLELRLPGCLLDGMAMHAAYGFSAPSSYAELLPPYFPFQQSSSPPHTPNSQSPSTRLPPSHKQLQKWLLQRPHEAGTGSPTPGVAASAVLYSRIMPDTERRMRRLTVFCKINYPTVRNEFSRPTEQQNRS